MIQKCVLLLAAGWFLTANSIGFAAPQLFNGELKSEPQIIINNRVLATVNGNPISVLDLMKKMDLMFYQQHSEYLDSVSMRYQFYMASWKEVLKSMIDRELIMLDAQSQNMQVTSGDVREEIEEIFGPDVLENLDQAGLTYAEVTKLIHADILIRRMLSYSVNMKALKRVTPDDVVQEYECSKQNSYQDLFHFRIISVKADDIEMAKEAADQIIMAVHDEEVASDAIMANAKEFGLTDGGVAITVTPIFVQKKNEFSAPVYEVLSQLEEGKLSAPAVQKGGIRLYLLEKRESDEAPPFSQIEDSLREALIRKAMMEESERYFAHLRKHYDLNSDEILSLLPSDFKPFELK